MFCSIRLLASIHGPLALDDLFPPRDEVVLAWLGLRSCWGLLVKLGDVWAFFDDVHGGGIHDQIFCDSGEPLLDASGAPIFRCTLHYEAAITTFEAAGYTFPQLSLRRSVAPLM